MKLSVEYTEPTLASVAIEATEEELSKIKTKVLKKLAPSVNAAGFRKGNVPMEIVEKNIDAQTLQAQFVDEAVNTLYIAALKEERLRPVGQPKVDIKKFVPFTQMSIVLELPVVGEVKLPNYKKHTAKRATSKITKKQIDEVVENLKLRSAEKKEVKRAAKDGDEAWIDFDGVDKDGKAIEGASGKEYPLALGSGTFIPGFEDNVIGMKIGESKDFSVTFPKDYGVAKLQNAEVTFTVKLTKVNEVVKPKSDDAFAASLGPFKTFADLESDIKKQLEHEDKLKLERDYEAAIVTEISDKTKVEIPQTLIDEQQQAVIQELRQNVVQRGMTYDEYVKSTGKTEEEFMKSEVAPEALRRIKAGLVLSEIGDIENIVVTDEELAARVEQMKAQYPDEKMQEELAKPENQREIMARLRSEKVINFLKTQK